jgi:N-acetylated-alpha-linked acidic dipeptidase
MTVDEAELIKQVSREKLWETNRRIAERVRISGSEDERESFGYIKGLLAAYGLRTTWLEHPALISYPIESDLQVVDDGRPSRHYTCLSHAFSASVPNLEAELVDLGSGTTADYAAKDARGKVVLLSGLATPTGVYQAEQAGAVGEIFINDDHLHNMIVSTVWGTPTPRSASRLPTTPAVSVIKADGRDLRARLAEGNIRVRIHTNVFTGWRVTPLLVGEVEGHEGDEFVMLSGHVDSWDKGAMDNGSANATMLEVGRLLAQAGAELHRGLRVIFWSGHSHGRYSGSTWYADHYWEELYDRCVAHVNVDSTGARGASYYGRFQAHAELGDFGVRVIEEHTGQRARPYRMTRAGDMSFNGIGIPALFMELSQMPVTRDVVGEMPWWWHTSEDTIDKVDLDVLELDTKIYLSAIWRLCRNPLLPADFRPVVSEMRGELSNLQKAAGEAADLSAVQARVEALAEAAERLSERAARARTQSEISALNKQVKALSRILIPLTYTMSGRFEQDPAWDIPYLPALQGVAELARMDPKSDEFAFLKTEVARGQNSVLFALRRALEVMGE